MCLHIQKGVEGLWDLFHRGTNPSSHDPIKLPRTSLLSTIILGGVRIWIWGGHYTAYCRLFDKVYCNVLVHTISCSNLLTTSTAWVPGVVILMQKSKCLVSNPSRGSIVSWNAPGMYMCPVQPDQEYSSLPWRQPEPMPAANWCISSTLTVLYCPIRYNIQTQIWR